VKVVITAAAKRDLIGIADYIRPHNPGHSASFVVHILHGAREYEALLFPND
jgi:plasmid stabilization system protein ParE